MKFDDRGRECPDPRPVSVPHGWARPLSLHEEIKRFVRSELSRAAADQEAETFEESDDFEVEDDPEWVSPYEVPEAPLEAIDVKDPDPPLDPGKKTPVESPGASEVPSEG